MRAPSAGSTSLDELERKAGAQPRPLVALELQWGLIEDDPAEGYAAWVFELHLFSAQPGWHDGRCESACLHVFPAEQLGERLEAVRAPPE